MKKHDITKLPKWVQEHIADMNRRIDRAEKTIPWTKPGMRWSTLFHPDACGKGAPRKVFHLYTCSENGTHPVCCIGPNDTLFIGRGRGESDDGEGRA
jgi:hypothetical protein